MKTAELFEKYVLTVECSNDEGLTISEERTTMMDIIGFENALAEYKQSIIGLIDEIDKKMDKVDRSNAEKDYAFDDFVIKIRRQVLLELKQKIEEL